MPASPEYKVEGAVSKLYKCSVCTTMAAAEATNERTVWLLKIKNDFTFTQDILDAWQELIGSATDQLAV